MAGSGPDYLRRVVVRRVEVDRADHPAVVVLLPAEVVLGRVLPHDVGGSSRGRRGGLVSWTFVCEGGDPGAAGWYRSRREAAESCAVEAIDGAASRRRFDLERWERWRPDDN